MHVILSIWHWFQNFTGTNIPTSGSKWYNFWSGFGSDFGELAILGSLLGLYKHHDCAMKGCLRVGHHSVDGTPYITCHKHATIANHKKLHKDHEHKFPEQHRLLNKNEQS
jgi:hypothetical protein